MGSDHRGRLSTQDPCRQVFESLQSGHIRSPMSLDWNDCEHIRHFLIAGFRFSACGFLGDVITLLLLELISEGGQIPTLWPR